MYEDSNFSNENNGTNMYHYEEPKRPIDNKEPKKNMGTGRKLALGICCGLLFGIFAGVGFEAVTTASSMVKAKTESTVSEQVGSAVTEVEQSGETKEAVKEVAGESSAQENESSEATKTVMTDNVVTTVTDVTTVVKNVMPAVVSVNNKYIETTSFFGQQYSSEGNSSGSGIIVGKNDTELLLVSNNHVVQDAEELTVQFVNGTQATAQIKGTDADKDLAVIAVLLDDIDSDTMNSIAIAELGDSDALTVGEPVIAIGNALGYGQSVTTGVVSALNRAIPTSSQQQSEGYFTEDEEVNTFIQTDAAINPGNSGGALLNSRGQVIGINSSKIGGSTVEGMGYAIPISDAKPIIEDLMTKETKHKVSEDQTGYLGITGLDVQDEYSEIYGMPKGVFVSSVSENSGAARAGLVRGDVIVGLNGETVTSMEELKKELSYHAVGEVVELTIMQGSPTGYQEKSVLVTLGKAPETN